MNEFISGCGSFLLGALFGDFVLWPFVTKKKFVWFIPNIIGTVQFILFLLMILTGISCYSDNSIVEWLFQLCWTFAIYYTLRGIPFGKSNAEKIINI